MRSRTSFGTSLKPLKRPRRTWIDGGMKNDREQAKKRIPPSHRTRALATFIVTNGPGRAEFCASNTYAVHGMSYGIPRADAIRTDLQTWWLCAEQDRQAL